MDTTEKARTAMEQYFIDNLDRAMEEHWIKAYHQPLVRAASGKVANEESLAGWVDPERGAFSAEEFIPVLEEEKLSYKLDLYMVDRVLLKLKIQSEHGLHIVPESVNLSRSDFDCCDMVKEITQRVDASGISRNKFAVELSEDMIAADMMFMKKQIERFRSEGIQVWMDDFGSGYSSLLILLNIRFDLLKIDKVLTDQIEKSDAGKIIMTELVKTAVALGMDTSAEGVETAEQVRFLKEIGCTKLQGYHYIKPIDLATIIERNNKGIQIGFENPEEIEYYDALGRVNLYDLSISKDDGERLDKYFDTLPMVVFALDDEKAHFVRCNKSYRNFVDTYFPESKDKIDVYYDTIKPGVGYYSFNEVRKVAESGKRAIIDDRSADGKTYQLFVRRIAVNPVTKMSAVGIVVLSVADAATDESLTYNYVARALSEDYLFLFLVDLDTGTYAKYAADGESRDIVFKGVGHDFYDLDREGFEFTIYEEDHDRTVNAFTRSNIEKHLKENGIFSLVTRYVIDGEPTYVNIKAVKVRGDGNRAIVGINNINDQMKDREIVEKAREERLIYARIGALSGDYIYIYTVDSATDHYNKYNPTNTVSDLGIADEGDDFFGDIIKRAPYGICKDDLESFLAEFTKENVYDQIEEKGLFENYHRLNIGGKPIYVVMRAALVKEEGTEKLIVGILDIDERVKREQEYEENLSIAQIKAYIDELTGVKNKHAYVDAEHRMNEKIDSGKHQEFGIAVFDLNGLKQVNDTLGHKAGDEYIKRGCDTICRFFKHSPVFRVGGDEFVVIVRGYDYLNIESIMYRFKRHNVRNETKGDVVVAAGYSAFDKDPDVASVFVRADSEMYRNKEELKKAGSV